VKDIGKTLTKALFYLVAIVLIFWTASLTVSFIRAALPLMAWYVPFMALVVFDGGMIAWLFVFLKAAEGTMQRAVAIGLTGFDFIGVTLLVMAEILLGGQSLTAAPAYLGTYAIWGIGIWTAVNVLGVLVYHIGEPSAQVSMAIQNEKDQVFRGALLNMAEQRQANSVNLAKKLGDGLYQQLLDEMMIDRDGDGRPDLLQAANMPPVPQRRTIESESEEAAPRPPQPVMRQRPEPVAADAGPPVGYGVAYNRERGTRLNGRPGGGSHRPDDGRPM
jgi:hypothetical protein